MSDSPPYGKQRAPGIPQLNDPHRLFRELLQLLAERPNELLSIFERALDGIWFWDVEQGQDEWMSPRFWSTLGVDPATQPHSVSAWQTLIDPDDLKRASASLQQHLNAPGGTDQRYEQVMRYRAPNGDLKMIRCTGQALLDEQGHPYRMLGLHSDISHQIAREHLQASQDELQRLHGLANFLPQLIWTCTADGACDFISESWAKFTGSRTADLIGEGWFAYVHPDDQPGVAERWAQHVASGEDFYFRFRIRRHDGEYRLFDTRAKAFKAEDGKVIQWFGSNTDIQDSEDYQRSLEHRHAELQTEVARRTRQLEAARLEADQARRRAEEANTAKSRFLSAVSHELRTPLNGISGLTFTLQHCDDPEQRSHLLNQLDGSVKHLNTLVSDVLDMNKIEEGRLNLDSGSHRLPELCRSALAMVEADARRKGLRVDCRLNDGLPEAVICDAVRLRQVLVNLLNNAVKFTSEGFVSLNCRQLDSDDRQVHLRFEVHDSGIGIEPRYLEKITHLFEQGPGYIFKNYGGSGLGLSLSRRLLQEMGGDLEIASEHGRGSCVSFELCLPLSTTESADRPAPEIASLHGLTLLVVDDIPLNRTVANSVLSLQGARVIEADNGREALERLAEDTPIDAVLMDIHMPEMDGLQATRAIRELPGDLGHIPVIGLTGVAEISERDKALQAGMNDVILKPMDAEQVAAAVRHWCRTR